MVNGETVQENPSETITPSIVRVYFPHIKREYSYYNDSFSLEIDDGVFVSGKLYGEPGFVTKINTQFKINLQDYQRVIAKRKIVPSGTFHKFLNMMVSFDSKIKNETVKNCFVAPPLESEGVNIVCGEESVLYLDQKFKVLQEVSDEAMEFCKDGNVQYIGVNSSKGLALIFDKEPIIIEFELEGNAIKNLYCDCKYHEFELCSHKVAFLTELYTLLDFSLFSEDKKENFTVFNTEMFIDLFSSYINEITFD